MSNTASLAPASSINTPSRSETPAPDAAVNKPTFTRPNIESGKDRMFGNSASPSTLVNRGRDPEARARLESTCQQLFTRMHERNSVLGFAHEGQEGVARYIEHGEPALSVSLGSRPNALEISSMANISYGGKPFVQLTGAELQAANALAVSVLGTKVVNMRL